MATAFRTLGPLGPGKLPDALHFVVGVVEIGKFVRVLPGGFQVKQVFQIVVCHRKGTAPKCVLELLVVAFGNYRELGFAEPVRKHSDPGDFLQLFRTQVDFFRLGFHIVANRFKCFVIVFCVVVEPLDAAHYEQTLFVAHWIATQPVKAHERNTARSRVTFIPGDKVAERDFVSLLHRL